MSKSETLVSNENGSSTAFVPKILKNITLPLIKPSIDVPVYIKITSEIFVGKAIKKAGDGKDMEAAKLVSCINLETGEESQIIVPSVLNGILTDDYPDATYIDKGFKLVKHAKGSGKAYHAFSVAELDLT